MQKTTLTAKDLDRAYERFGQMVQNGEFPTGVLAVGNSHGPLRLESFGEVNGKPVEPDDVYLIYSVTKPIVGTAIMQLVERGILCLNSLVTQYWPEFGYNGKEGIKLWHLLTHTSGMYLPHPKLGIDMNINELTPEKMTEMIAQVAYTRFAPGTKREYNNEAFWVMGEIVRRVTGIPFTQYLQENVLNPLGMGHTSFDLNYFDRQYVVPILDIPDWVEFSRLAHPAGGLFSTASDLLRFGTTYLRNGRCGDYQLLSPATIEYMTARHTVGLPTYPGCEWLGEHDTGLTWQIPAVQTYSSIASEGYFHGGWAGCQLYVFPKWDLCCVLMTNKPGVPANQIVTAVLGCVR